MFQNTYTVWIAKNKKYDYFFRANKLSAVLWRLYREKDRGKECWIKPDVTTKEWYGKVQDVIEQIKEEMTREDSQWS